MKFRALLIGALVAFSTLAANGASQAATIDFTGLNYNMGVVAVGQTGEIKTTHIPFTPFYDFVIGELPSHTQIVFSYTFKGKAGQKGSLEALATYLDNGFRYLLSSDGDAAKLNLLNGQLTGISAATLPVSISTAMELDPNNKNRAYGTTTIVNLSAVAANFTSFFKSFHDIAKGHIKVTYTVSAVPLPAALPLFGFGLVGLAGIGRMKKGRKET